MPLVEEDERLEAAVSEARSRWSEFVQAFDQKRDGQVFSVKARFQEGKYVEWMWVIVTSIEEDKIILAVPVGESAEVTEAIQKTLVEFIENVFRHVRDKQIRAGLH